MKSKLPYIIILILLITNLISIGYVERYCEVNQEQRNKALLNEYLLTLTNKVSGDIKALKETYPNITIKNNRIIINNNSVLRNSTFKKHYGTIVTKSFYGFEFKTNKKGKIISSGFYQP